MPTSRPISFDRVADLYDGSRARPRVVEQELGRLMAELIGDGRTLDIGIGTGRVVADLLRHDRPEVVGIDVSRRMLRHAVERGASRVLLADGRALPFRHGAFDFAMTTHVLHLVAEWPKLLREVTRVTRRNYVSVLEYETSVPDPTKEYMDAAKRAGEALETPGLSERTLVERLAPDLVRNATPLDYRRSADLILAELEARSFRGQWALSPSLHDRIMSALRPLHAGHDVAIHLECRVVAWEIARVREFADGATMASS